VKVEFTRRLAQRAQERLLPFQAMPP